VRGHVAGAVSSLLAASLGGSASAQIEDGLAACADVGDTLARLACYDELATSAGHEPPEVVPIPEAFAGRGDDGPPRPDELPERGIWETGVEYDEDSEPVAVNISSWAVAGASTEGYAVSIAIACRRGRTSLSIRWEDYLGSWTRVSAMLGDGRPRTRDWNLSSDGRSSFYPQRTVAFIDDLIATDRATFEVTPYSRSPVVVQFDTSGLGEAFEPWRELCRR
jgi:type VI secretion system protein VasI